MKYYLGLGGLCLGAAVVLAAPASTLATPTEVTGIELRETPSGLMLMMQTAGGDRPQIFLVRRGNSMVADLINTKLRLPQGQGYSQNNPVPGIASLVVTPLDANSTRVIVTGAGDSAPEGEIVQEATQGIALNYRRAADAPTTAASPPPGITGAPQGQSQGQSNVAQQQRPQQQQAQRQGSSDVLVPNPGVEIDGVRIDAPTRVNPAPPFQPRAVAPPVGDISVSSVDTSSYSINLGTAQRVPRLVLRDAPVEEVMSLLARAAGLNLAYVADDNRGGNGGRTISLDIEDEAVQDVFNNVLRLSGLEANREGNTIVVGERLPDSVRPIISRTIRLNQLTLIDARNFLLSQGAESSDIASQTQVQSVRVNPDDPNSPTLTTETTRTTVELLSLTDRGTPYQGYAALPLRGLLVSIGQRQAADVSGNELTLVGDPRKVEMATQLLTQLETRRRQVAINVKIVDVSLSNQDNFNTSFSFQVGDTFVSSDGGAAIFNFGGVAPPSRSQIETSPVTPPIVPIPSSILDGTQPFFEPLRPSIGPRGNPGFLQPGVTDINVTDDGIEREFSLPNLFSFPSRFIAQLQAQVESGNAKILTDPTLVVQEGQTSSVNLTSEVVGETSISFIDTPSGTRETREVTKEEVGLQLGVTINRIDDNGFVTLQVNPEVSSPVGTAGEGAQTVTLIQRRSINSGRIRIRDGQTLIVSGIIQESDRSEVRKVPILGDIPLLGSLFRRTVRDQDRQEVIVILTPNILNDSDPNNFGYTYTPGRDAREVLQQQRNFTFPQPQQ